MHGKNTERTFEHHGHLVHIHAFRDVTDTWTIQVAVVGNGTDDRASAKHVAWNKDLLCDDPEDALNAGAEMARNYVADIATRCL